MGRAGEVAVASPAPPRLPVIAVARDGRSGLSLASLGVASTLAVGTQIAGVSLAGPGVTTLACLAILILGLPHGSLDVALIRREGTAGLRSMLPLLALYLACAGAMWTVWRVAPMLALGLFLAVAVAHFAQDWSAVRSPVLAAALAAALLTAPALLHRAALGDIFVALTARSQGRVIAEFLLLAAPMALCIALCALCALQRMGHARLAAAAAISLAGMIVLPPAVGFALFFGLCHSPHHFGEALRTLSRRKLAQWSPIAAPTLIAAFAIGAALYRTAPPGEASMRLTAATFMLLSVLTVPHMTVPLLVGWIARRPRGA